MSKEKEVSRRGYVKYAGAGVVVVAVAAAGGYYATRPRPTPTATPTEKPTSTPTEKPTPTPTEKPTEKIKITGLLQGCPPTDGIKHMAEEYKKVNPNVEVFIEEAPWPVCHDKAMTDFAGKTGVYDFVILDDSWVAEFSPFLIPLKTFTDDPEIAGPQLNLNDFLEKDLDDMSYKGTLYGLPYMSDVQMTYYRKDLFEDSNYRQEFKDEYGRELEIPQTWEEYRDIAKFFTRDTNGDGEIDLWGCAPHGSRGYNVYDAGNLMHGNGLAPDPYVDLETMEPWLNNEKGVEAMKLYLELIKYAPEGAVNYTLEDSALAFEQGLVALCTNWYMMSPEILDPSKSKVADVVGYAVTPKGGCAGVMGLPISKFSQHPNEAYKFTEYALSIENAREYCSNGGVAVRYTTFEDAEKNPNAYPEGIAELWPVVLQNIEAMWWRTKVPEWVKMEDAMGLAFSQIEVGEKSVEDGLNDCANELRTIFEDAGYY